MSVSDKLKIIDNNFVIGSGMSAPHNCPFSFGMFFIDVRRKLAWAAQGEDTADGRKPHESPHFLKATQFCRGGSRNGSLTNRRGSRHHAGDCTTD